MIMEVTLSYEYDFVNSDKILSIVQEFEKKLKSFDPECVCKNFQIKSNMNRDD